MSESVFVPAGGRFLPTEHARGPWDPRALHGGAPAALITAAFERVQPGAELRIARLGFEFLRPIPLAPLKLSTRIVRPGRRVQELAAELSVLVDDPRATAGGPDDGAGAEQVVCRASAVRVRAVPAEVPEIADAQPADRVTPASMGAPADATPVRFTLEGSSEDPSFAGSAMEMRWLEESWKPGPGRVWMRLRPTLVAGEAPTPLARLAASADFGNGVSAALPFERFLFINADLTIHLQRSRAASGSAWTRARCWHRAAPAWPRACSTTSTGPSGGRFRRSSSSRADRRRARSGGRARHAPGGPAPGGPTPRPPRRALSARPRRRAPRRSPRACPR
ncbi:MAG TPA: thioesterase family protein [Solirubrobacteraceae bacterium]|nr:thioesterase family protein [Solirubrobacteraceae bacterium]